MNYCTVYSAKNLKKYAGVKYKKQHVLSLRHKVKYFFIEHRSYDLWIGPEKVLPGVGNPTGLMMVKIGMLV